MSPTPAAPDPNGSPTTTVPAALYTLDPTTALVADLDALTPDPAARLHADGALWLTLTNILPQLAALPARRRPAYLRACVPLWTLAAQRWHQPRYTQLGARLARWRAHDPSLPLIRHLLWALEQLESVGGVRLAYTSLSALLALVPPDSRRAGHILAQSGRPLRTLGALDAALDRYELGAELGVTHRDPWLHARSRLGAGGVLTFRGNHPAARSAFADVLRLAPAGSTLAMAAHHGLVLCTTAAGDYAGALRHGWQAFHTRRADATARAEALSLLADLSTRLGRHESAIRAAQSALQLTTLVRLRISLLRIALNAARTAGDAPLTREYAAQLAACIGTGGDRHEDAAAWLALAELHASTEDSARALDCLDAADALAIQHGYHQLRFRIHDTRVALEHHTLSEPRQCWQATTPLDRRATAVLDALAHLPTSAAELLVL